MKRCLSWMVLLFTPILGCATLQDVSSGQIGCPSQQIQIRNEDTGWASKTWTAECNGKIYYCSAHGGGQYSTPQVACKEQADGPRAAPPPPPGGCQYDTQCKGDRVCRNGSCVDSR